VIINQNLYTFNCSQTGQRQDSSNILRQGLVLLFQKTIFIGTLSQHCANYNSAVVQQRVL